MPKPPDIDALARRYEPAVARILMRAWRTLAESVPVGQIADAMRQSVDAVLALLPRATIPEAARLDLEAELAQTMQAAAVPAAAAIGWRFGLPDEIAARIARETAGRLIVDVAGNAADLRDIVARVVSEAFMEGGHPYQQAQVIRDFVGMLPRDQERLRRYAAGLWDSGVSERMYGLRVDQFAQRMWRDRARMIARTETIRAARQGQREAWNAAADEGLLERDRTFRVWVADGDACDLCQENEAASPIPYDAEFPNGFFPHPNCECSETLTFAEEKRVAKPLGDFPDWDACVTSMTRRLGSRDAAERYCGKLESLAGR